MQLARSIRWSAAGAVLVLIGLACSSKTKEQKEKVDTGMPPVIAAEFKKRVDAYAALSQSLVDKLPKLPKDATPQRIDQEQRSLELMVVQARAGAQQGDFFTPDMQAYVRTLLDSVFAGPLGASERKAVHDEPHPVRPVINKRYPDDVPLATMPPKMLANLPTLPNQLEYRFVHNDLILLDVHAHIILDFVEGAMGPASAPTSTP